MEQKPHAVCFPYPAQGHINPMLKLAKLLNFKGFRITFVNTEYNSVRLLRARGPDALNGLPSFRFEAIPDGLPGPADADVTQDTQELCRSIESNCVEPFRALLTRLNDTAAVGGGVPPVTCVITDPGAYFSLHVAEEFGLQTVVFWPAGACCLLGYAQYPKLIEKGIVPFKDDSSMMNGQLDMVLDWVEGANGIRLRDIPTFIRTTDPNAFVLNYVLRILANIKKASAILFNTFEALEHEVLQSLSSEFPPLYSIGPIEHFLEPIEGHDELKSIRSNLWKEDSGCVTWLHSFEAKSVVYVNFGSITIMTNDQFVEFAWGLANSKHPFLWITRPDLVIGDSAILPPEFLEETKDRGLIANWCNQEEVLAHPAIGVFLTHNGWNSTFESICNGVPMISWPFFADQQTNCWYCCTKWGIGMEIDVNVRRGDVESQVKEIMEGEKGKEMKKKATEWKKLAQEATQGTSGSSYSDLEKTLKVLLPQH